MKNRNIAKALTLAVRYGGIDANHHKAWVIDQMVRALTNCPIININAIDCNGKKYTYPTQGESKKYKTFVKNACYGEDGPNTYEWDIGIIP